MPAVGNGDVLGPPYTQETIELPPDEEGPVVATLVTLPASGYGASSGPERAPAEPTKRAVLHVHGFADYFFQTEFAEWWSARGYTFYALDLRKYGRSLRDYQTPNYVADLGDYDAELDLAWWRITERDGHTQVVASAHSTGGLTLPLWANRRRPDRLAGMVLNSPWFDLQGSAWLRSLAGRVAIDRIGARQPKFPIPRDVSGLYARSLHRDHEGEWDFDLAWKPLTSQPVYAGWVRAVRNGHNELHAGLDLDCPALVLSSTRTHFPGEMSEDVHTSDIVLDVQQIRRWAPSLGRHVTTVAVQDALHDVVLSRPDVRAVVYDEIHRWLTAYVEEAA